VRSFDDVFFEGSRSELFTAYKASSVAQLPSVGPFSFPTRLYFCRCNALNAGSERPLGMSDELLHEDLPAVWRCGGHPPVKVLMTFEGVPVPASPDWAQVIETTFRQPVDPADPHRWPKWITALYARLAGTKHPEEIDAAASAYLYSDDPLMVSRAIRFYWGTHLAPGTARLRSLALEDGERLRGLADPLGTTNLHHQVLRAVAFHISTADWAYDGELKACFRAHVEAPGHLATLALFFAEEDEQWLRRNRKRLLAIDPDAAAKVARWLA
jgi:hypothetical protein